MVGAAYRGRVTFGSLGARAARCKDAWNTCAPTCWLKELLNTDRGARHNSSDQVVFLDRVRVMTIYVHKVLTTRKNDRQTLERNH